MDRPEAVRICPRCGGDNRCGFGQDTPCWCATQFEPETALDPTLQVCYCVRCLRELREQRSSAAGTT